MAHTQTWNAAFEAIPANGDDASEGALRIRNLKRDIRERLEIDHNMDETDNDGEHLKVTFYAPLASDPTNVANKGFLYTKDVSSVVELFWEDESGNVLQLTSGGDLRGGYPHSSNDQILIRPDSTVGVATGWSTEAVTDKAVKILSSAVHNTADGGTNAFSVALNTSGTHGISNSGNHSHTGSPLTTSPVASGPTAASGGAAFTVISNGHSHSVSGSTGNAGNHNHTHNHDVRFSAFRIVSKD